MQGNVQGMKEGIKRLYGQKVLDALEMKARACTRLRDRKALAEYFRNKIKELEE
jgi:hypothetical protein